MSQAVMMMLTKEEVFGREGCDYHELANLGSCYLVIVLA